jgi:hypothetical protein
MTGGPFGRDDLSKSRRDLLAVPQSMRSRAGQAAHHRAMKRYVQLIKMAPHDNAGLIGKAQAPHIKRRGQKIKLRFGSQFTTKAAAGARLFIWARVGLIFGKDSSRIWQRPIAILLQFNFIARW